MRIPSELEERYIRFLDGRGEIIEPLLSLLGEEDRLLDYSGARAAALLSRVYLMIGELDKSLACLRLSSRSFHAMPEAVYPFGLWINRALIMKYGGRSRQAGRLLRHTHRLCLRNNQSVSAARASSNLAVILARAGKAEKARSYLEFSRRVYICEKEKAASRYLDLVEAVVDISSSEYRRACDSVCRFLERCQGPGSGYRRLRALLLYAEVLLRSGRYDAASEVLRRADAQSDLMERFPPQRAAYLMIREAIEDGRDAAEENGGKAHAGGLMKHAARLEGPAEWTGETLPRADNACRSGATGAQGLPGCPFIAGSPAMKSLISRIRKGAALDFPVLLTGPTGSGKSLLAGMIHNWSGRGDLPFVSVNSASLSGELFESVMFGHRRGAFTGAVAPRKGLVETAAGGTLFLDEISELDGRGQARLLDFLDTGRYRPVGSDREGRSSARIIAASNRDLEEAVESGSFREDLYYRLNVFKFRLPPLSSRREDIIPLARHFLSGFSRKMGAVEAVLSEEAERALFSFSWPGNVRQLKNEIAGALFRSGGRVIRTADLSAELLLGLLSCRTLSLDEKLDRLERDEIIRALETSCGNRSAAARILGLSRTTLLYRIKRLGLG
ncbi:MAG: sigma-54 dependent transcriptional regulator [Candidatus Krumholzibacteriales bacterium]